MEGISKRLSSLYKMDGWVNDFLATYCKQEFFFVYWEWQN